METILKEKTIEVEKQKNIFRFAATLFAETSDTFSATESRLQMIKCIFVNVKNEPLSLLAIVEKLQTVFGFLASEEEIDDTIKKSKKVFQTIFVDGTEWYKLLDSVLSETIKAQENGIEAFIDKFIQENKIEKSDCCKKAIYKYLYELTTTNINAYRVLIRSKAGLSYSEKDLSIDVSYLSLEEQNYVNKFVSWDDQKKNITLTNLVFACLEYCLLINGDKPNRLLIDSIRKREIYLDTNIIFRALGINGILHKNTVNSFLKKCKQAGLKMIVLHSTRKEFFDTIDFFIDQIRRFPRGNIYSGAYEQLSDYSAFSFYEDWRQTHPAMSLIYFKLQIKSLYEAMVKKYGILDNELIPSSLFNSEDFIRIRNEYASSIRHTKDTIRDRYNSDDDFVYSSRDNHDAIIITWIENRRNTVDNESDVFFVSSDKILRYWDMARTQNDYPVVIYPSQLFLVLLKTCGRSSDDFGSFVSFININPQRPQLSAEKANVIISGISSITEDIRTQKLLVSAICDGEYQDVLQSSREDSELYKEIQSICQNYLQKELKEKEERIKKLEAEASTSIHDYDILEKEKEKREIEIGILKKELASKKEEAEQKQKMSEERKEKVCAYAKKKTTLSFAFKWYVFPIISSVLVVLFFALISFQFLFSNASWNIVIKLMDRIGETQFGKNVPEYYACVDGGIFAFLLAFVVPNIKTKPWDKEKRDNDRQKRIERYIEKHNLL